MGSSTVSYALDAMNQPLSKYDYHKFKHIIGKAVDPFYLPDDVCKAVVDAPAIQELFVALFRSLEVSIDDDVRRRCLACRKLDGEHPLAVSWIYDFLYTNCYAVCTSDLRHATGLDTHNELLSSLFVTSWTTELPSDVFRQD